ncbi:MAG: signal peptide peptidase SppA [FCB group bacterium]|nr:signal peptide peptidase SppA [FCB group bacterium]
MNLYKSLTKTACFALLTISLVSGQLFWNGLSVATSDNIDALALNPAGLGIARGEQSALQVRVPKNENEDPIYFAGTRMDGFGYTLYGTNHLSYNLALGGDLGGGLNFGYRWDSHKINTLGFLYRPVSFGSLGITGDFDKKLNLTGSRMGLAVRPFGYRLTLGADVTTTDWSTITDYDSFKANSTLSGFIELQPVDGIFCSFMSSENGKDISLNLGFDFNLGGINIGGSSIAGRQSSEYGFYTHSQVLKSILKTRDKKALHYVRLQMSNMMIEEKPEKPFFNFNLNPLKKTVHGTQLRTWIEKLDKLTADENVDGLIIDYEYMGGGLGKLYEVRQALERFKAAGKKIIVYGKSVNNIGCYLLSMADEIYVAPLGEVDLRGLNLELNFYKGLMDKLDIVGEFEQISPYKTAPDPFLRKEMSPEMRENYGEVFDDLYEEFVNGIASGHGWSTEKTNQVIDNGPYLPAAAIEAGLITGTKFPDEFESYIEKFDGRDVRIRDWDEIDRKEAYVNEWKTEVLPTIAIVYAVGGIVSGESNPGPGGSTQMGDETITQALKDARENEDVSAVVFRIDSGGGSALASDMILREVNNTTDLDTSNVKPLIASMSDVAGSGGYWIACQSDKIVAYPTTITGSIGVLSGRINYSGLLKKLGITSDKIKYGKHSDFYSANKLWSAEEKAIIRKGIIDTYEMFKEKVAAGREGLEVEDLDPIALGRIWSGTQAKDRKLIDEVGGLSRAIELAKQAAGIPAEQEVNIVEYPKPKPKFSLLKSMSGNSRISAYIPDEIMEQLEILRIIPIIEDDEIQLLMPFTIKVK